MGAFIVNLIIQIVIAIVIAELFGRAEVTNAKPYGMGDFKFPTASSSRSVPVVWGTQELKAPNLVWAGDFHIVPIKKRVKVSLFKKKNVTVGYLYYIGMQLALCHGGSHPVGAITRIRFGDKIAWEGSATHGEYEYIRNPNLYGGEELGGGIRGYFRLLDGREDQELDGYIQGQQGEWACPHQGVALMIWYSKSATYSQLGIPLPPLEQATNLNGDPLFDENGDPIMYQPSPVINDTGMVSNSSSLRPMFATVFRQPNQLGVPDGKHIIGGGANPACMIYEILTEPNWGLGWSGSMIYKPDLLDIAQVCYDEGLGLSMTWNSERLAKDMMQDILDHIAGVYFEDKNTGQLRFRLIRGGYDPQTLPLLEKPAIIYVKDYSKTHWDGSMNAVNLAYSEPTRFYENEVVTATDLGNAYIQGRPIPRSLNYYGITSRQVALNVAYRELRMTSLPLARVTLVCKRDVSQWNVGDLFRWGDADYGVESMVLRVNKIERGDLYNQEITMYCSQDPYSIGDSIYTVPDVDGSDLGDLDAQAIPVPKVLELPYHLTTDGTASELGFLVEPPNATTASYDSYMAVTTDLTELDRLDTEGTYVNTSVLVTSLGDSGAYYDAAAYLDVLGGAPLELTGGIDKGYFLLIDDELVGYDLVFATASGHRYQGLYRGMLNTTQKAHNSGSKVYQIDGSGLYPDDTFSTGDAIDYKLVGVGLQSQLSFDITALYEYTVTGELTKPYVLTELKVDGAYRASVAVLSDTVNVTWGCSPKDLSLGVISSGDASQAAVVTIDYTLDLVSDGAVVDTYNVQTLATQSGPSYGINLATVFVGYQTIPPYLQVWIQSSEGGQLSTQKAVTIMDTDRLDLPTPAILQDDEPVYELTLFDGEIIGVR